MTEQDYEGDLMELGRRLANERIPPAPVVFYGSSSIRLWETLKSDFPGRPVVNAGFGGSTLAACVHYFERVVLPLRPRSLVLYAGDNDLADGAAPEEVAMHFRALVGKFRRHLPAARLTMLTIKPSPARWHLRQRIEQANALLRRAAKEMAPVLVVDIHPLMLGADGTPRLELFAADTLHLSPAGYEVWRKAIEPLSDQIF